MAGYTKLFADIVTSTIWQAPNDARVLWISLLALKGKDNICRATVPALAKMCDLTLENCETILNQFQQPDKYSRSQEHEGRRIKGVDGGWLILNGEKYQNLLRQDERRDYVRHKVAEHRARKQSVKSVTESKPVISSDISPDIDITTTSDTENTPRARDSERWPYEQSEQWVQALVHASCKIGPKNWPAWKKLVEAFTLATVLANAEGVPAIKRWPDAVEDKIKHAHGQLPLSQAKRARPIIEATL